MVKRRKKCNDSILSYHQQYIYNKKKTCLVLPTSCILIKMNINFDLIFYFFTLNSNGIHIGTHKQCVLWITINKIKILTTSFPSSIDYLRDDKFCGK
jgi:hypothetical protein